MPADPASNRFRAVGWGPETFRTGKPRRGARRWVRPGLEALEDRLAPSVSPLGPEFPVNTFVGGDQSAPVVASAAGNSVVVWQSLGQDGSFYGVFAQRYDAQGNPLGGEFQVNTFTTGNQGQPAVAAAPGGNFVITWQSDSQDGSQQGVYARRYDASGNPLGGEFRVNTFTAGDQISPAVAVGPDGNFVITWRSSGQEDAVGTIYAQRYDATGDPLGTEIRVSAPSNIDDFVEEDSPAVAIDPAGNFVITWITVPGTSLFARTFDVAGNPLGEEFGVAGGGGVRGMSSFPLSPTAAVDAGGNFVIAWRRAIRGIFVNPERDQIEAQRIDVQGNLLGSQFLINIAIVNTGDPSLGGPSLAVEAGGNLLFAWTGEDGSDTGVFARRSDAEGNPLGGPFRINPSAEGIQRFPSIAVVGNSGFLVAWEGQSPGGSDLDIFARRYALTEAPAQDATTIGAVDPGSGTWYLRNSNSPGAPDFTPFAYGAAGWLPVGGDWDADGSAGIGVVDPASSTWYLRNANSPGGPDVAPFAYGAPGWTPVVGDWFGAVADTVGVVDPATLTWYLRNANSPGDPTLTPFAYGAPGWVPVAGDWDGDGIDTIGVFDPATATWYLRNSNSSGAPDLVFAYGAPGWIPLAGDWDGDGTSSVGAFDPSTGTWYLRNSNSPGAPDFTPFAYGVAGWAPVVGNWANTPQALHAAGGRRTSDALPLSLAELATGVSAALARLEGAGVDPGLLSRLAQARYVVTPLGGSALALADPALKQVAVDPDGAGHGWFVDPTPHQDEEFVGGVARPGTAAEGRMDLLSVVLHEMGHLAGRGHTAEGGLMGDVLGPGARALDALDEVFRMGR
jgi:hypothetical protein